MRVRLKVCCIASVAEAALAVRLGADALGLVGEMPSGPGVIDDALAAAIARSVPPPVTPFLLTSRSDAEAIADHARDVGVSTVQVVRHVDPAVHARLAERAPQLKRVQVLHVEDDSILALAAEYAPLVDALLLDSGRPSLAVAELGGTGRAHDWDISRRLVAASPVPVFLAGGLKPDNAAAAIDTVRPFGLDVCSGVRTDGALDATKLAALVFAMAR